MNFQHFVFVAVLLTGSFAYPQYPPAGGGSPYYANAASSSSGGGTTSGGTTSGGTTSGGTTSTSQQSSSSSGPAPAAAPSQPASSPVDQSASIAPSYGSPTSSGSSTSGSTGGNSQLNTQCRQEGTKFICDGVPPDAITLKAEHILWLTSAAGVPQVLDIEVPNYKIQELIKAGFKPSQGTDTKINVLLKRPEQSADAQVDVPKASQGQTSVNLQYEPPADQKLHFPNDKAYQPLSGPLLPPGGGPSTNTGSKY